MAKKKAAGAQRKKKKSGSRSKPSSPSTSSSNLAESVEPPGVGAASVDGEGSALPDVFNAAAQADDAGGPWGGASIAGAKPPTRLADGEVGTDPYREAKIQETLERLGVKGAKKDNGTGDRVSAADSSPEAKSINDRLLTIFDIVPPSVQLGFERLLIAGFSVSLAFFVACGVAIGVDAYFVASKSDLPPDLDRLIVEVLEPAFTPSLIATFGCSILLGVWKLGQMGQANVAYREDD